MTREFKSCCIKTGWKLCVAGLYIMLCRGRVEVMCRGSLHHVVSRKGGSYVSRNFASCWVATGWKLFVEGLYIMMCRVRVEVMCRNTLHHVVSKKGGR